MFEHWAGFGEGSATRELSFQAEARMLARGSTQEMVPRMTNMFRWRPGYSKGCVFQLISQIAAAWSISSPCPVLRPRMCPVKHRVLVSTTLCLCSVNEVGSMLVPAFTALPFPTYVSISSIPQQVRIQARNKPLSWLENLL